nr:MAG TPA: hypothetical protein [Ackermannviridae sp.]
MNDTSQKTKVRVTYGSYKLIIKHFTFGLEYVIIIIII